MIILDENIIASQRLQLTRWKIHFRKIIEEGVRGMQDEDVLRLLQQLHNPTFFTCDVDYCSHRYCHRKYSLVFLKVREDETAMYIRRVLRHRELDTAAKRTGAVVEASKTGMRIWRSGGKSVWVNWLMR